MSIIEELLEELERVCKKEDIPEKAASIIKWFAEECMTTSSRIGSSELKAQVMRLGKYIGEESDA